MPKQKAADSAQIVSIVLNSELRKFNSITDRDLILRRIEAECMRHLMVLAQDADAQAAADTAQDGAELRSEVQRTPIR